EIVTGILGVLAKPAQPDPQFDIMSPRPGTSWAPYRLFNIGGANPVGLMEFIGLLEKHLGREAQKRFLPMQPGDVEETYADTSALEQLIGPIPRTGVDEGLAQFVAWFKSYHRL